VHDVCLDVVVKEVNRKEKGAKEILSCQGFIHVKRAAKRA